MGIYYHYTDTGGLEAIERDGLILASSTLYGAGVFLSDLDPEKHEKKKKRLLAATTGLGENES